MQVFLQTKKQRRLLSLVFISFILTISLFAFSSAAQAQSAAWSRDIEDTGGEEQLTGVDGSFHALHCSTSDLPFKAKSFNQAGIIAGTVSPAQGERQYKQFCDNLKTVDANGVLYGTFSDYNTKDDHIMAYYKGTELWNKEVILTGYDAGCDEGVIDDLEYKHITAGADGYLYLLSKSDYDCDGESFLSKIRPSDGAVLLSNKLGSRYAGHFSAYKDGLVMYDEQYDILEYYSYAGLTRTQVVPDWQGLDVDPEAATADGRVYFTISENRQECDYNQTDLKIVAYDQSGKVFEHDLPPCSKTGMVNWLAVTPDNNVAFLRTTSLDGNRYAPRTLVKVTDGGTVIQNQQLPEEEGIYYYGGRYNTNGLAADTNGNILLARTFDRNDTGVGGMKYVLSAGNSPNVLSSFSSDTLSPLASFNINLTNTGMAEGRLYVMPYCYTSYSTCPYNSERSVFAVDFPGLGIDYPRGALLKASPRSNDIKYLALGDSYSSGEGDLHGELYYLQGTDGEFIAEEKCHLSVRSYPFLVASQLDLPSGGPSQKFASVACSGANRGDIIDDSIEYDGSFDQFEGMPQQEKQAKKDKALKTFFPGRAAQIEFVKQYKPDVLTVGIGGNDIGFKGKLKECIFSEIMNAGTSCPAALTGTNARANVGDQVKDLYSTLRGTANKKGFYEKLHDASPNTKIYAVGYPNIIKTGTACNILNAPLDDNERQYAAELVGYLNDVIEDAAHDAGIAYIDIENSLAGMELCSSGNSNGDIGVNGVTLGDDTFLGLIGNESFHPNYLGQVKIAQGIDSSIPDLLNDPNYCNGTGVTLCPSGDNSPPPLPAYFVYDTDPFIQTAYNRSITKDVIQAPAQQFNTILGALDPGSTLHFELHSNPVDLGTYTADANGQVDTQLTIPAGTAPGYHQLHAYGTAPDGTPINRYDDIMVIASETDYDGDGIANDTDKCNFVQPANTDTDNDGVDDACDPFIDHPPQAPTVDTTTPPVNAATEENLTISGTGEADTTAHISIDDANPGYPATAEAAVQASGVDPATYAANLDVSNLNDGPLTVTVSLSNQAGTSPPVTTTITKDTDTPDTTATTNPAEPATGTYTTDVTVTLTANDQDYNGHGTGVKEITYSASGAQTIQATTITGATTTITLNTNGQTYLHYYATDNAGNVAEERMMRVDIDKSGMATANSQHTTPLTQLAQLHQPWLWRPGYFNLEERT